MNIQSLSVCVPAKKCINDCVFCCSKMHTADYEDRFSGTANYFNYSEDMKKRLEYARENGCNTCMLTGSNEPQQNREFLKLFGEINRGIKNPFLNIEMQTTGAFIDGDYLDFLKSFVGVTTVALSVACLDNDEKNRAMIRTGDKELSVASLCKAIKERDLNLRICLNMNDGILADLPFTPESIMTLCEQMKADQITFRALWASESETEQGEWIKNNVTAKTSALIAGMKNNIKADGKYLDTLEYGSDRYDYRGFSIVMDEDSMAKKENKNAIKYLILRPNGHLYSKWDSKASLIF